MWIVSRRPAECSLKGTDSSFLLRGWMCFERFEFVKLELKTDSSLYGMTVLSSVRTSLPRYDFLFVAARVCKRFFSVWWCAQCYCALSERQKTLQTLSSVQFEDLFVIVVLLEFAKINFVNKLKEVWFYEVKKTSWIKKIINFWPA